MSYSGLSDGLSPYNGLSPMDEVPTGGGSVPQLSSTEGQTTGSVTGSDPGYHLTLANFEKQPPDNMRKSNFFNFVISLFDGNHQPVEVHRASFKDFYDTHTSGQEFRNGLIYKLTLVYSDGTQKEEELFVRLIDSHTKQLVPYEGTCKNPDFRRVLLTHELICSRCLEHRSCGNKNDTPSDPIIIDRFRLKFFVKCNQNCLKNAGNPKDSRRRFQVALYSMERIKSNSPIATSDSMFVHNNSKHGRRPAPFREAVVGDGKPYIISVYPNEGWMSGGTKVCIVGMNFFEGIEVVFGTLPANCEVLSPNAIAVKVPQSPRTGEVDITLIFKGSQFCITNPGKFLYISPDDHTFDHNFSRLERLLRKQDDPEDVPKDILLKRAADTLEEYYAKASYMGPPGGSHFSPLYYPRSPALFTPAILTPRFSSGGLPAFISPGMNMRTVMKSEDGVSTGMGSGGGGGVGYPPSNPVSRCSSSDEAGIVQNQHPTMDGTHPHAGGIHPHSIFQFPNFPQTVEPMAVPYIQVAAPAHLAHAHHHGGIPAHHPQMQHQQHAHALGGNLHSPGLPSGMLPNTSGAGQSEPSNGFMDVPPPRGSGGGEGSGHGATAVDHHSNRNNNNSAGEGPGFMTHLGGNPMHLIPKIMPTPLPPSPGYLMAPTATSPGPLPATPTGPGSSVFNFPPLVSPAKAFHPFKPTPLHLSPEGQGPGATNFSMLNYPQIFAALPSPNYGTFLFPPVTPTSLIAPLNLPDLSGSSSDAPAVAEEAAGSRGSAQQQRMADAPPAAKKPRTEDSPAQPQ